MKVILIMKMAMCIMMTVLMNGNDDINESRKHY